MLKKFLLFSLIFYILALVQTSFLPRFSIFGQIPNLILITLFLIIIFDEGAVGIFPFEAALSGLFLDIFSRRLLGVSIFLLCLASIFLQEILKVVRKHRFVIPCVLFFAFVLFYEIGILFFDYFLNKIGFLGTAKIILIRVLYDFLFLALAYGLLSALFRSKEKISRFVKR